MLQFKTMDDYFDAINQRYPENGHPLMGEDIRIWFERWLGFRSFLEDYTTDAFVGESVRANLRDGMVQSPRDTWAEGILQRSALLLGWTALQISFLAEYLKERERKEGLGAVLEDLAKTDGDYATLLDDFSVNDGEAFQRYNETHPGLHDFSSSFFLDVIETPLRDEEDYQRYVQILERGDTDDCLEQVMQEYRWPILDEVVGEMFMLTGFFNHLQMEEDFHRVN